MRTKRPSRSELHRRSRGCAQLERHAQAYREYLLGRGNADGYVRNCEAAVAHLSMWMNQGNKRLADLGEGLVAEFLERHLPHCSCATSARHPASVRAALGHLLVVLRAADAIAPKPAWARRLKQLRSFTRWLQQFEPATEVPDDTIFGRLPERQAPHIYSDEEVQQLLAAARRLGPKPGLRGLVYETLFGLIASTGLRLSEALSLSIGDVDLRRGLLTIRRTKFAKSRQVPLHLSTMQALSQYRWMRDLAGARRDDDAPFFIGTRGRRFGKPMNGHQVDRIFATLRSELAWVNRGTHHAPRVHDLRHTFVVRRVLLWQQQGIDVDQAMLSLSTYVGHAMVTNTYWYMQAVPELMAVAAQRFESCMPELSHD